MLKTILAVAAAGIIAGASYLVAGPNAAAAEFILYKTPGCGCCESYADYLRDNDFTVTVRPTHELTFMSREAGIPDILQGCHLAFIDNYVVSGHVSVGIINRILSERPDIKGVTLPGMPTGSPGMSGIKAGPFVIWEISESQPKVFAVE
ncbi:MAG: DUF411 domain-containing protein [Alphaproteobacteria bacterium]|uniref:DUF411 domain-containing protein n=1 Tax=Marinobacter salarius TaxID=1420917 RepID=UPI0032EDBD81